MEANGETDARMKRLVDFTLAAIMLLMLSPLLGALALLIRSKMGSPILFRQQRLGLKGKPFWIYKFRSMQQDASARSDAERLTALGAFLRKYSLDELPQLFNVLKGDMSLIGPRPLLIRYAPYFTEEESARFRVRPGLTGLAQINGRNALSWNERLAYDVRYVEERTWAMDVVILYKTIGKVLRHQQFVEVTEQQVPDLDMERQTLLHSKL